MTTEDKIMGYLTAGDMRMHMLIEVLDGLEESYNLDIKDGIDRHEDNDLILWAKRVRRILARSIEHAGIYNQN
jgi:hypothetical protein